MKNKNSLNSDSLDYNLEEFAVKEDANSEIDDLHLNDSTSKFELNKEALKPTISNSSEINLEPILKPATSAEKQLVDNPVQDTFVVETAPEEVFIEENLEAMAAAASLRPSTCLAGPFRCV